MRRARLALLILLTAYLGVVLVGVAMPVTIGRAGMIRWPDGRSGWMSIPLLTASNGRLTFQLWHGQRQTMGVLGFGEQQYSIGEPAMHWTAYVTDRGPWIDPPHPADRFRGMLLSHVRLADGRFTSIGPVPHALLLMAVTWCWFVRWRRSRTRQQRGFSVVLTNGGCNT